MRQSFVYRGKRRGNNSDAKTLPGIPASIRSLVKPGRTTSISRLPFGTKTLHGEVPVYKPSTLTAAPQGSLVNTTTAPGLVIPGRSKIKYKISRITMPYIRARYTPGRMPNIGFRRT